MKIIIPGGSGHVGTLLSQIFYRGGHEVVVLSRSPGNAPWRTVQWDGLTGGPWMEEINGADVVINLAGRSVNCRYGASNRREILDSRVDSTRIVGEAIGRATNPPRVWLQASTATIYAHRFDAPNDEATGILGGDEPNLPDTWKFSLDVANAWERVTEEAVTPRTRKVLLRSAIVMARGRGGPFDLLASAGATRSGRARRRRKAVRLVDSRSGFRSFNQVADRARGLHGHRERRVAEPAAERGVYAGAASRRWCADWLARSGVDARNRCPRAADRDGVDPEKPTGCPRTAA